MRKWSIILTLTLAFAVFLSGCGTEKPTSKDTEKDGALTVYTTVYPLAYFTEQIGGEYVNVSSIYPAGVDEHTFEPTQKDIIHIADADLFFYIGHNLEGFVYKANKTLKNENVSMLAVGEKVKIEEHEEHAANEELSEHEEDKEDHGHQHGSVDPHLWIDPIYAKQMAAVIKDTLTDQMPEHKETFHQNYKNVEAKLDELDKDYKATFESAKHKEFLVSHAAFGYWEERYDVKQLSVSGISTADEPTQKALEKLVDTANDHQLHYILTEQNVSNKLSDIIQKEAKLTTLPIHNLANLTEDDSEKGRDYFSIAHDNLDSIKKALNE